MHMYVHVQGRNVWSCRLCSAGGAELGGTKIPQQYGAPCKKHYISYSLCLKYLKILKKKIEKKQINQNQLR